MFLYFYLQESVQNIFHLTSEGGSIDKERQRFYLEPKQPLNYEEKILYTFELKVEVSENLDNLPFIYLSLFG